MKSARTGNMVSSIAGHYATITPEDLLALAAKQPERTAGDIRSMATSLLRQDEVKGWRRGWRRLIPGFRG